MQAGDDDDEEALIRETQHFVRLGDGVENLIEPTTEQLSNDAGLLYFDGGSYSSSLADIGSSHLLVLKRTVPDSEL